MTSPNEEQQYIDELIREVAALELDEKSRPLLNLTLRLIEQSQIDAQTINRLWQGLSSQRRGRGDAFNKVTEAMAHLQEAHSSPDVLSPRASKSVAAATFALTKALSSLR